MVEVLIGFVVLVAFLAIGTLSVIGTTLYWIVAAWGRSGTGGDRVTHLPPVYHEVDRTMRDLDAIARARVENREVELTSIAADAGIDWRG